MMDYVGWLGRKFMFVVRVLIIVSITAVISGG